jgi:hypothetical protein
MACWPRRSGACFMRPESFPISLIYFAPLPFLLPHSPSQPLTSLLRRHSVASSEAPVAIKPRSARASTKLLSSRVATKPTQRRSITTTSQRKGPSRHEVMWYPASVSRWRGRGTTRRCFSPTSTLAHTRVRTNRVATVRLYIGNQTSRIACESTDASRLPRVA